MGARLSRRELIFKGLQAAAVGGFAFISNPSRLLAEPIRRSLRSDEFTDMLLLSHGFRFLGTRERQFEEFCARHGFDRDDTSVASGFMVSRFFHELIRKNGILGNRYLTIEGRRERISKKDGSPLGEDETGLRGPRWMLKDMLSGRAGYLLDGRRIHCFGDCDEYEMAYTTLLGYAGIDARILMSGPRHVKTVVSIGGKEILVDNTRNIFGSERRCGGCPDHRTGAGGFTSPEKARIYLERINRMAHAGETVRVWPRGERRIERRVSTALDRMEMIARDIKAGASACPDTTGGVASSLSGNRGAGGRGGSR